MAHGREDVEVEVAALLEKCGDGGSVVGPGVDIAASGIEQIHQQVIGVDDFGEAAGNVPHIIGRCTRYRTRHVACYRTLRCHLTRYRTLGPPLGARLPHPGGGREIAPRTHPLGCFEGKFCDVAWIGVM